MRYRILSSVVLVAAVMSACSRRGEYDYRIMVNYELGMHCTGFDFS